MRVSSNELLMAYVNGVFPMADEGGDLHWYCPDPRAIIPIKAYKPQKSLRPIINRGEFEVRTDQNFERVIRACAKPRFEGDTTWISEEVVQMYVSLFRLGYAHSVETYRGGQLVGGLYGVHIGSAFFGESMFHTVSNSSKVAFHFLIEILRKNGFLLLDTQFINDNVLRYGALEIKKEEYMQKLSHALQYHCPFAL